jgi:antirestriction protein ArdC
MTFNAAKSHGGNVRKDERGTVVIFWKRGTYETEDAKTGEKIEKNSFLLRYYNLFNAEQVDGLKLPPIADGTVSESEWDAVAEAERIADGMPNPPSVTHAGASDRAFYRPSMDAVTLPARESFGSANGYYTTLFHELGHSTGHATRLKRAGACDPAPFGSETYSQEELVAEFSAAFLTAHSGITNTVENSTAYIAGWLKALRSDSKLVVIAAAQGQKAAEYILGGSEAEETTKEEAN